MKREAPSAQRGPEGHDEHFFMLHTPPGALSPTDILLVFVLNHNGMARWFQPEMYASVENRGEGPSAVEILDAKPPTTSSSASFASSLPDGWIDRIEILTDELEDAVDDLESDVTPSRRRQGSSDKM